MLQCYSLTCVCLSKREGTCLWRSCEQVSRLVPCFPLDCSRILASVLLFWMEPGKAAGVRGPCIMLIVR